jgi:hypothetical protein
MFQEQVLSNLSFENLLLISADVSTILSYTPNRKECTRLFWLDVRQQIESEIDGRFLQEGE